MLLVQAQDPFSHGEVLVPAPEFRLRSGERGSLGSHRNA